MNINSVVVECMKIHIPVHYVGTKQNIKNKDMKYIITVNTKRGEFTTGIKDTSDDEYLKAVDTVKKIHLGEIKTLELTTNSNVVIYIPEKILKNSVILVREINSN